MKALLSLVLLFTVNTYAAGTGDTGTAQQPEKFVTLANCSGTLYADNNALVDKGSVQLQIRGKDLYLQADTAIGLKNFKEVYKIVGGQPGWIDQNNRLRDANIYAKSSDGAEFGIIGLGYNPYDKEFGANFNFDANGANYRALVTCDEVK